MKLANFRIKNFKCFQDTGEVTLSQGVSILCGQNNAGKTALLQALEMRFQRAPHRSTASLPKKGELGPAPSEVQFTISLSGEEFEEIVRHRVCRLIIPPAPGPGRPHPLGIPNEQGFQYNDPRMLERVWRWFIEAPEMNFRMTRLSDPGAAARFVPTVWPSHSRYDLPPAGTPHFYLLKHEERDGKETFGGEQRSTGDYPDIGESLSDEFVSRIYRFSAERFGLGESRVGTNKILASDASNLPEVLNILQSNAVAHEEFVSLVTEILPQIRWVNVEPINDSRLRVNVWTIERKYKREDLAIPLAESGTGIGQVLSILYVAFTSERSRVLLLDEPQSFLHPGAARKLIEVLKRFPQHQYIVSTHSAAIIAAARAPEVLIVRSNEGRSSIGVENTRDNQTMQLFLQEVGARLSDLFGMDRVIWVEGPTEEVAIPLLLEKMRMPIAGTAIVSIRNTGDLEGKDKKRIFEIYNSLTRKASILPPAVAFILDSEARTPEDKNEIHKLSSGTAHFLPQRTFENYLLNVNAICAVANGIARFSEGEPINPAQVERFLAEALQNVRYWRPYDVPRSPDTPCPGLHGALILHDMFVALSQNRVSFRKTEHSVSLFRWILENEFQTLGELAAFIGPIVDAMPEKS